MSVTLRPSFSSLGTGIPPVVGYHRHDRTAPVIHLESSTMSDALRLLLVEDSEADAELLARELKRAGFAVEYARAQTAREVERALDRGPWDIIVGDNTMPGFSGTEALEIVRKRGLDIPFIFVSGTMGEDLAASALEAGGGGALAQGDLPRLLPVIRPARREAGEGRPR